MRSLSLQVRLSLLAWGMMQFWGIAVSDGMHMSID